MAHAPYGPPTGPSMLSAILYFALGNPKDGFPGGALQILQMLSGGPWDPFFQVLSDFCRFSRWCARRLQGFWRFLVMSPKNCVKGDLAGQDLLNQDASGLQTFHGGHLAL